MLMNHEVLMRAFEQAREGGSLTRWRAMADDFITRQDTALREAREGMRQLLEQLTELRTGLANAIEPLREDRRLYGSAFAMLDEHDQLQRVDPRRVTLAPELPPAANDSATS